VRGCVAATDRVTPRNAMEPEVDMAPTGAFVPFGKGRLNRVRRRLDSQPALTVFGWVTIGPNKPGPMGLARPARMACT